MPCSCEGMEEDIAYKNMLKEVEERYGFRPSSYLAADEELCAFCKKLSVHEIEKVGVGDPYKLRLKRWYLEHLCLDYTSNKDKYPDEAAAAEAEAKRFGYRIGIKYVMECESNIDCKIYVIL